MDPRFFKVETIDKPSEEELRKPFLYKYFRRIPEAGRFTFLDGGWVVLPKSRFTPRQNSVNANAMLNSSGIYKASMSSKPKAKA